MSAYGLAMFQHVVVHIMDLSTIYRALLLSQNNATLNQTDVYYQLGRAINIFITVPPSENYDTKTRLAATNNRWSHDNVFAFWNKNKKNKTSTDEANKTNSTSNKTNGS